VSVLGVALAYAAWRRGRPGLAGFALGFTAAIAKPQLVIGIAAYMVGRRDWRAVAGALAGAALSLLIALLAVGPHGLAAFVSAVSTPHNSPTAEMQGSSGLFGSLLGQAPGVYFLSIGAGLMAAAVAGWLGTIAHRRTDLFEPSLCGAVTLSLFASPHLLGHDLTLVATGAGRRSRLVGRPAKRAGVAWARDAPGDGRLGAALLRQPRRPRSEQRGLAGTGDPVGASDRRCELVCADRASRP